ncbi:MAG: DUF3179 domain-containing protein [Chloroflexi bacterium]|nr:MAG: DUF3179 domain-containing protein [Chloroflexota bacterium]
MVYSREIDGEEFTFGVSGKLIRNVLVMYDRQTETLWSQLLGEAVEGELIGTKLEFVPSWMTTWEQWKEMHPDTVALDKGFRTGKRDTYDSYYASGSTGVIGETLQDDRLYVKEFITGVELDDAAIAYPFSVLNNEPVVNDSFAGMELLVVFDANTAATAVFDRTVNGQLLTFAGDGFTLTDVETGSTWDIFSGEATDGPLAGTQLERIKSTTSFWFGWKDFHPDTRVYGIDDT